MSKIYGFLLEFIPMKIGAGMTFFEVTLTLKMKNERVPELTLFQPIDNLCHSLNENLKYFSLNYLYYHMFSMSYLIFEELAKLLH